jgi:hypothetical protein
MPIPRPILRRKPLPKQAPPAVLNQRLRQQQRLVTTPGFAARVRVQGPGRPAAMVPIAVAALLGCVGGVGVFLGWLQASWMLAAGGAVAAAAGVVMGRRAMRPPVADTLGMAAIDEGDAARLDAVVERCAPELPDAAVEALTQLAATLGRMAPQLRGRPPGPPWRTEDSLFIGELLRRYVPDSLQRYLEIPAAQRPAVRLDDGRTPAQALSAQLDGLAQELAERETLLAQASSEALALQGAFLEARRKG